MRKARWAVWGNSCCTDDEPMHWFCPTNPNTWCKYNAAINNNLQNYKHKPSVAKAVRDVIKPVFGDLSHPALLKKCLGGKTQNPNESLNSLIWKFCPKTIGSRLQIAEIAAKLATSVFNPLTGYLPPEKLFRKRLTLILRFPSKMQQTFSFPPFRTWEDERGKF
ncbi:uncharacterized protein TNCV_4850091 [Trichonephila clavipes]|nr:uncharacterized protein TNCV_4850091 [Trichonephila clavipes]